ncbi:MAG: hypothetical protein NTX25_24165 [Proteobacteria bacterium]|nr:hypothetical protein [Pseudomonadota bacterium]
MIIRTYLPKLLIGILIILGIACHDDKMIHLNQLEKIKTYPEKKGQNIEFASLSSREDFQDIESASKLEEYASAWLAWNIESVSNMNHPALLLGLCLSIDKVYWGETLLADFKLAEQNELNMSRLQHPILLLPSQDPNQILWIHVLRSQDTGLRPDCKKLSISSEIAAIREFLSFQAFEALTGTILLFLAILGSAIYLLRQQSIIASFCLFSFTVGGALLSLCQPVHFAFSGEPWIKHTGNSLVMMVPSTFFCFYYQVLGQRIAILRWMTILNCLPPLIGWYLIWQDKVKEFIQLRTLLYEFIPAQIGIALIFSIIRLRKATYPAGLLTQGLAILFLGSIIDLISKQFHWSFHHATAISLLIFMGFLLNYIFQIYIDKDQNSERDRFEHLQNYSKKLVQEINNRSQNLREKTEELEYSNQKLREKNILLSISHQRLEQLLLQKDGLLKKLAEIDRNNLPTILICLNILQDKKTKISVHKLSVEIYKLSSLLEPFVRLSQDIESLKGRSLWLLEPAHQLLMITKMALGGSRVDIQTFLNPEDFIQSLIIQAPQLALISCEFPTIIQVLQDQHPELPLILSSQVELSQHIELIEQYPGLCHIIQQSELDHAFTQKDFLITVSKIFSNDIFGLEKYLNWGVDVNEYIITSSNDRSLIIEMIETQLSKAGILRIHLENVILIADEMLMNAIYDAPVSHTTGKSKYNNLSRRTRVELEPSEYANLRFAFDGSMVAISISDPFGSLRRETFIRYLKSCFEGQLGNLDEHQHKGGGGTGLYQILSSSDLMVTNIRPGKKTEVIALVNVSGRVHSHRLHKSFHYFEEKQ